MAEAHPDLLSSVDVATVKRILADEFPWLPLDRLDLVPGGPIQFHTPRGGTTEWWTTPARVVVNGEYIFRFPTNEQGRASLERAAWVVRHLRGRTSLAVPGLDLVGRRLATFGYRMIPGVPLDTPRYRRLPESDQLGIGTAIGRFLAEMHLALAVDEAAPVLTDEPLHPMSARTLRLHFLPRIADESQRSFAARVIDRYEQIRPTAADRTVLHNDLHGHNMLFDPVTCRVAGIVDFADVAIGDRHMDLFHLYSWDEPCLLAAITEYQRRCGVALSPERCIIYNAAQDFTDLTWRTEQNVPIAEGPLSARIGRLQQRLTARGVA
ncbi:MAG TPA: aminoglycoside phosphotransferase family protein [Candidatus Dormibacteraeota bacterium]